MNFAFLTLVTLIITIDNALLCGVLLHNITKNQRRITAIIVAATLGSTQGIMAIGISQLASNLSFRIPCILILFWMCYKTLKQHSAARAFDALRTTASILVLTTLGSVGNILWLGLVHNGDHVSVIFLSVCSIPLFAFLALFFAEQADHSIWLLYLGAVLMAWIAASLIIQTLIGEVMTGAIPPLVVQMLLTLLIMLMAFAASRHFGAYKD